jgi:hypothetical protein
MSTLITSGSDTITPILVMGYEAERESGNIVHQIIGRANPDVTLRPARLRTGNLELLFSSEADAMDCVSTLANAGVCAVVSDERATVIMSFVLAGRLRHALDPETRDNWIVTAPYQEVTP